MTHQIIKRAHVQVGQATSHTHGVSRGAGQSLEAQGVKLLRDGDDIRAIEITCACGEVTVVELQYPTDSLN
jgi:hypothetical protein